MPAWRNAPTASSWAPACSSGTARVLIVQTGKATVFGQIAERLSLRPPETEFERGIQRFGYLLTQVMLVMVVIVLAVNIFLAKPPIDSLLFALALAVGLTPELLPAIISITLSHGAQRMAKRGVIVRRLNAIENFGSMDVLCTDKTGTLTEGVVRLDGALDAQGQPSAAVLRYAYLNAHFQTGLNNPLDEAIQAYAQQAGLDISAEQKVDEIPYDFVRKRLSVVTADAQGERTLITKGALDNVLSICNQRAGRGWRPSAGRDQRGPGSNSATATGATRASACWAWRRRRSTRGPKPIRAAMKATSPSPASCSSSIRPRPMCSKPSSIWPNAACSSRSSPATTRRWRGTSRRR